MPYAELQVTTNYSFLRGASHPEELFAQAAAYDIPALGVTDHGTVAGIVRAWDAAKTTGVRLVAGCRFDLRDGATLLAYPTDRPAWSRLCRLITLGKSRAGKTGCDLDWDDLATGGDGLLYILVPDKADARLAAQLDRLRADAPGRAYLAGTIRRRPGDPIRLHRLAEIGAAHRIPLIATGDVLFHHPERRILQDVVTCIREGCTIDTAGFRRERFADRHLKPPEEMARLFARHPDAIARTKELVARCSFDLGDLRYQYPDEQEEDGLSPQETLERLTWAGAAERYKGELPDRVTAQLKHELELIRQLDYAPYFLTVNSIVRYARSEGILCQGRGSAANSAVCYVLGVTSIDPTSTGLLFERFVSAERREPPDIDVDFEHEQRERVIQWVYEHYGRDRAALCATVIRYRARGAMREVGKVLGLTEDTTSALSSQVWGWSEEGVEERHAEALNLNLEDRRLRLALDLAQAIDRLPAPSRPAPRRLRADPRRARRPGADRARHDEGPPDHRVGQGRHRRAEIHEGRRAGPGHAGLPAPGVRSARRASRRDARPVHHPAGRSGHLRHDPARRHARNVPDREPGADVDAAADEAAHALRPDHPGRHRPAGSDPGRHGPPLSAPPRGARKAGIPAARAASACSRRRSACRCSRSRRCRSRSNAPGSRPARRTSSAASMATFKLTGGVHQFHDKLISGMERNGYSREFAEKTFKQIEGFGSYGFPESHAASFAIIAYASCWVKCHHPDVFCCALLNAQPMGFYAPAQIVRDAIAHGVEVRPVDVNHSRWDSTLEPGDGRYLAVRLGLRMAKGLAEEHGLKIVLQRGEHAYASVEELWRRAGVPVAALERLAEADAYRSLHAERRDAIWAIQALRDDPLPLFAAADNRPEIVEPPLALAPMRPGRTVVEDYGSVGLTLRQHPVAFVREDLAKQGMVACGDLERMRDGRRVVVPGLVLVRQKPGSAKGVMFITIEDETGIANLIVWPSIFERQRRLVLTASMIACEGKVQKESGVTHVIADRLIDLSGLLREVGERDEPFLLPTGRGDEARHGGAPDQREKTWKPRDIYCPERLSNGIKVQTRDFR